jgi:hypothetical protein
LTVRRAPRAKNSTDRYLPLLETAKIQQSPEEKACHIRRPGIYTPLPPIEAGASSVSKGGRGAPVSPELAVSEEAENFGKKDD